MHRTQYYLVLDRADRDSPRWVVAKACTSHRADVPASLDRPGGGLAPGTHWLRGFDAAHFSWLEFHFGRQTSLRMTPAGEECFATRISHNDSPWTEYDIPVHRDDTWGDEQAD